MRPGPHQDKVFEGFHKPMPWIELSEHVHVDWTSTASTSSQKRRTKHADDLQEDIQRVLDSQLAKRRTSGTTSSRLLR